MLEHVHGLGLGLGPEEEGRKEGRKEGREGRGQTKNKCLLLIKHSVCFRR